MRQAFLCSGALPPIPCGCWTTSPRKVWRPFLLVHAGLDYFSPEKNPEDYDLEDFLFCRPEPNKLYYQDQYLVYGHTPTRLLPQQTGEPPMDTVLRRGTQIAIDGGCGFGGCLGCLCLETLEEFYV